MCTESWSDGENSGILFVFRRAASCPARGTSRSGAARRNACAVWGESVRAAPGPPGAPPSTAHHSAAAFLRPAPAAGVRVAAPAAAPRRDARSWQAARRGLAVGAGEAARNHSSAERASRRARSENAERKRAFEHRGRRRGGRRGVDRGGPGRPGCAPPPRPAHGDGRPRAACCSERAHQHAGRPIIGVRAVPRNARQGGAGPR